jgi:DNA invertase Pin-like site-specific DNA recombinase
LSVARKTLIFQCFQKYRYLTSAFDRPEWNRLMEDVKKKRISCIVVKDLSRFGRNYIETGNYLEMVFPVLKVRFIAVNDNYDSEQLESSALQPLDTMIKGIVNEAYAKDISRKIFTAKEIQRKNGLYYGNVPPYGYCKDPADPHHLIVNQETAPTVRQIFQWKLEGMGNFQIARLLNESNIAAPMRYQFLAGAVKAPRYENSIWQGVTVKVILSNRTYTGDLAMGKKRKNLSKNLTKIKNIPYEDWIITENTHEAIISREIFFEVQRICMQELEKNRASRYCHSDIDSPDDIFAGLVYSGNTGLKMYRTRNYYEKHGMKYRYTTISQRDADYSKCSIISIKEEQIQETLVCLLKKQMELALELNDYLATVQEHKTFLNRKEALEKQIKELAARHKELTSMQSDLYLHYSEGSLAREKYLAQKEEYRLERLSSESRLAELKSTLERLKVRFSPHNPYIRLLLEFYEGDFLSKDLLHRLVDKIYVYDSKTLEVVFKYRDEIEPILKFRESGVLQ